MGAMVHDTILPSSQPAHALEYHYNVCCHHPSAYNSPHIDV